MFWDDSKMYTTQCSVHKAFIGTGMDLRIFREGEGGQVTSFNEILNNYRSNTGVLCVCVYSAKCKKLKKSLRDTIYGP